MVEARERDETNKKVSRHLFKNRKKGNDEEGGKEALTKSAKKKLTLRHRQMGPEVIFGWVCHFALVIFASLRKSEVLGIKVVPPENKSHGSF